MKFQLYHISYTEPQWGVNAPSWGPMEIQRDINKTNLKATSTTDNHQQIDNAWDPDFVKSPCQTKL